MSFDLYLIAFDDKQPSGVPRSAVLEAFGNGVRWEGDSGGEWQPGRNTGCRIGLGQFEDNRDLISCISVHRPVTDEELWDSLYQIMQIGNVALFYPGDQGLIIARESVVSQLPDFESPRPVVISSGDEILKQIQAE